MHSLFLYLLILGGGKWDNYYCEEIYLNYFYYKCLLRHKCHFSTPLPFFGNYSASIIHKHWLFRNSFWLLCLLFLQPLQLLVPDTLLLLSLPSSVPLELCQIPSPELTSPSLVTLVKLLSSISSLSTCRSIPPFLNCVSWEQAVQFHTIQTECTTA